MTRRTPEPAFDYENLPWEVTPTGVMIQYEPGPDKSIEIYAYELADMLDAWHRKGMLEVRVPKK